MFGTKPQGTAPCIRSGSTLRKRWEGVGCHTESAKGKGGLKVESVKMWGEEVRSCRGTGGKDILSRSLWTTWWLGHGLSIQLK